MMSVRPEALVLFALPDAETAVLAARLSSSVLVMAVANAQNAVQAVLNVAQLGVPRTLLAGAVAAVACQRLVRRICETCREPAARPAAQTLALHGIGPDRAEGLRFFRGKGCPACNKVGYRGRRAIFEVVTASTELKYAIETGLSPHELEAAATAGGMTTLRERCLGLVTDGVTTFDELVRLKL
jgi:type IV pilus assembly protein PilB